MIDVRLFNDSLGGRLVGVNAKMNAGKPSFKLTAAARCITKRYHGTANVTLYFPPGYEPSPQNVDLLSNTVDVTC